MKRKIAVIGGAGFIGTHLTKELMKENDVIVLDKVKPKSNIPFRQIDITDVNSLNNALTDIDVVFHLAAILGVDNCLSNEDSVIQINLQGTKNVIKACKNNQVKQLIFTSSSEVYGDGDVPFTESGPKNPKSTYAKTKLLAEELLQKEANDSFKVRIVRYFNVYGPSQSDQFVINRFINQVQTKREITIYGDGKQVRCFTYIDDAIRGTIAALEYFEGSNFEVFNIGSNKQTSILEVAEMIIELMKCKGTTIKFVEYGNNGVRPKDIEIFKRIPCTKKSEKLLGFKANISLKDGLTKLIS